jgi:hypothetical protein
VIGSAAIMGPARNAGTRVSSTKASAVGLAPPCNVVDLCSKGRRYSWLPLDNRCRERVLSWSVVRYRS